MKNDIMNNDTVINAKTPHKIFSFIAVFGFCLIILVLICIFGKYDQYYQSKAIVVLNDTNDCYLKLTVDTNDLKNVTDRQLLYINNHKYHYELETISIDVYVDRNFNNYKEILIKTNLPKNLSINNNVVDVKFKIRTAQIITYILEFIKGE